MSGAELRSRWGDSVCAVLDGLDPGRLRIAGSAVTRYEKCRDVDVFTDSHAAFAELLHRGSAVGIHPTLLQFPVEELQDRMSFCQCCVASGVDGSLSFGRSYTEDLNLRFNLESVSAFPSLLAIGHAIKKLRARGFVLPGGEWSRVVVSLHQDLVHLSHLVQCEVGEALTEVLAQSSAVIAGGYFRDALMGRRPKDVDVFCYGGAEKWGALCSGILALGLEEVQFEIPPGKRVNLRKFRRADGLELDVIDYGFVHRAEHVVETFDFSINMLWYDPLACTIRGSSKWDPTEIVRHIVKRELHVGDNLWYRAGQRRAIKRWARFRKDGFVADGENVGMYRNYVRMFAQKEM
jgi:hypothetical protein